MTRVASAEFGSGSFHSKAGVPTADWTEIYLIKYEQLQRQCNLSGAVHHKWILHKLFPFLVGAHRTNCNCDAGLHQAPPGGKL